MTITLLVPFTPNRWGQSMAKWFCQIGGQQYGPIESVALKERANSGRLKPTDKVRREGMVEWHSASEVKGLFVSYQSALNEPVAAAPLGEAKAATSEGHLSDTTSNTAPPLSTINKILQENDLRRLLGFMGTASCVVLLVAASLPRSHLARGIILAGSGMLAVAAVVAFYLLHRKTVMTSEAKKVQILGSWAAVGAIILFLLAPKPALANPVFDTPLTLSPDARPAIQVEIVDADTHVLFNGYYSFYLSVQSSRFTNSETRVLFPLNVGNFKGCTSKFVQLPFEVDDGDNLVLDLVYESGLSDDERKLVLNLGRATGYFVARAHACYSYRAKGMEPAYARLGELLAEEYTLKNPESFKNLAKAECLIQSSRPRSPQQANRITLIEDSGAKKLVRAHVRLYYPSSPLQ